MQKRIVLLIVIGFAFLFAGTEPIFGQSDTGNFVVVKEVGDGKIIYYEYEYSSLGKKEIDISNLELWSQLNNSDEIYDLIFWGEGNEFLRTLLLSRGYAKIIDPRFASNEEIDAQTNAQTSNLRIWKLALRPTATPALPDINTNNPILGKLSKINWGLWGGYAWQGFLILMGGGFVVWLVQELVKWLKRELRQRRFSLLIIGEASSGKTALLKTWVNPNVSKREILSTQKSRSTNKEVKPSVITRGRFEITPKMTDVPGSKPSSVLDELQDSLNKGLVVVIAPFEKNGSPDYETTQLLKIPADIDMKYIHVQLGYIQSLVAAVLGAKNTKKPSIIVLYISKFDLFSKLHPADSAAANVRRQIETLFLEHIDNLKAASKKAGIRFEVVIGSPAEKWNTKEVLDIIVEELFKNSGS